ncbi:MAG: helix-turn-helix transcriptional regulator [Fuerstia sp.]|nr:helix-turn-helix transcriptional regulator [Fuerstiella sp.]
MKTAKRSPCPVACTLDIIGDKWTLLVIRDMMLGRSHFKDFIASPEGIATNILADRLTKLVEWGLAQKHPSTESPGRDAYRLTKKGESLIAILKSVAKWGLENIPGTEQRMQPM